MEKFWLLNFQTGRKKRFEQIISPQYWEQASEEIAPFGKGSNSPLKKEMQVNDRIAIQAFDSKRNICIIIALATIKEILGQNADTLKIEWDVHPPAPLTKVDWTSDEQSLWNNHIIRLTNPEWINKVFKKASSPTDNSGFHYMNPIPKDIGKVEKESLAISSYSRPARTIQNNRLHLKIQIALSEVLQENYGFDNVHKEHPAGYGTNAIDIVVRISETDFHFYEIKTYDSARESIRQGVGQILEYNLYPDKLNAKELIIVSHIGIEMDNDCKKYMAQLRKYITIPIFYQSFNLQTKELSQKW